MVSVDQSGHDELDRNLAYLGYGLLFFAFLIAGAPALAAVAIAYARRNDADPLIRSHHAYQIWVFWISLGFALLMGASGLAAMLMFFAILFGVATDGAPSPSLDSYFSEVVARAADSNLIPMCLISCFVLLIATNLWLVGASAYGFVRLASGKPMGQMRV